MAFLSEDAVHPCFNRPSRGVVTFYPMILSLSLDKK